MIAALIGVGATLLLAAGGIIFAYGRNVQALTSLADEVKAARETLARFGERIGRLESRAEVEREFSGRVRGSDGR